MRYRRERLALPKDHFWTIEDWREFSKLDSKQVAEELRAPLEEVENVLFLKEEHWYTQEALPLTDTDLCLYVAKVSSDAEHPNRKLFARMLWAVFGETAEEFADSPHSWQDEWQNCQAGLDKDDDDYLQECRTWIDKKY